MDEKGSDRASILSSMARGAVAQIMRGVDAGVEEARGTLPRKAEAVGRRILGRAYGFAFAVAGTAWGSFALYEALRADLPNWGAALIVAGGFALASLIAQAWPPSRVDNDSRRPRTKGDDDHE